MDLTNEDVADVLALLDSLPYDELDLQTARFRLILRRTPDGWTQAVQTRSAPNMLDAGSPSSPGAPGAPGPGASGAPGSPGPDAPGAPATAPMAHRGGYNRSDGPSGRSGSNADGADGASGESGELDEGPRERLGGGPGLVAVRAPLPGTFYRAPRPGAEPFVEVGSRVDSDTVVGIVETMKLMNSVTAGVAGAVAEICLGNAEFAAHGATLLRIRAD
jgi:acetyl-CoA carboxylase biotin carboxyl carrier protein